MARKLILTIENAVNLAKQWKKKKQSLVLTGGCFDILHSGHIKYLQEAKKQGDILIVLLESDENIQKLKGAGRPVHSQIERAEVLISLRFVDYVILLPFFSKNSDYDSLIMDLKPDIIAVTENDPSLDHKKRQAKQVQAKIVAVTKYVPRKSSSAVLKKLLQEY